jgi:hypothetical protein
MEEPHYFTFRSGGSLSERAQNEHARFPSLEERIRAIKCGIEEVQGRTSDHENRGNGTIRPCASEEVTSKNASDKPVDQPVSHCLFWLSFSPLQP